MRFVDRVIEILRPGRPDVFVTPPAEKAAAVAALDQASRKADRVLRIVDEYRRMDVLLRHGRR